MSDTPYNVCVAVVDDDESLRRSLTRLLRASGIESVAYLSAEDFLRDVARPPFDCLVLDIQLGGMSGIDLARQLADRGSTIPVIFITAHDQPDVREKALRAGCSAYLRKSDPGEAVLDALRRAIR
jgi:FixJ family two-component response regulator